MKIVSRMIFAQIMKSSLFVLLTLVALFAFFDLIGQSGNIGTSYSDGTSVPADGADSADALL